MDRTDPRIEVYRDAAEAMESGRFDVELPLSPPDDIAALGAALAHLAGHLERRFAEVHAVRAVGEEVAAGLLLDDVCDRVYESFRELIPYCRLGLALLDDAGTQVVARWARSEAVEPRLRAGFRAPLAGSSLQEVLESGRPRILNDLKDHLREHPASASTRLILDEGIRSSLTCPLLVRGKAVGFLFFSSDQPGAYEDAHVDLFEQIAGQVAAVVEKTRLYEDLLALNQTKNRFLGMAAHDMRGPLMVILGWTDMLKLGRPEPLPAEALSALDVIEEAAEQLRCLVDDLLDISVIAAGELTLRLETIDLRERVRAWAKGASLLARGKDISIDVDLPDEPARIRADPRRIDQILTNLGSNALKFSRPGSTVAVRVRIGERIVLEVQDHGVGIPADELPRLFTEFGRTSAKPTGGERSTGLGLAITRRMVEAHGGTIGAESTRDVGSTFRVELPPTAP